MKYILRLLLVLGVFLIAACDSKFKTYSGPEVTRVLVYKESRMMYLMHHDQVLAQYPFVLGFAPVGHKQVEGDGRTPEGNYIIDHKNPNSAYHLSLGISYPNARDVARARAMGRPPGGDIFIHGQETPFRSNRDDWTAGCIAVSNKEIETIYAMINVGTPISIYP